jgi:hypothetical protein
LNAIVCVIFIETNGGAGFMLKIRGPDVPGHHFERLPDQFMTLARRCLWIERVERGRDSSSGFFTAARSALVERVGKTGDAAISQNAPLFVAKLAVRYNLTDARWSKSG